MNGRKHTTAWLALLGALLSALLIGGQIFVGVQQHYTNATVNNPATGVLHQHQMLHNRIIELELELERARQK